jgi:hypothetical protein
MSMRLTVVALIAAVAAACSTPSAPTSQMSAMPAESPMPSPSPSPSPTPVPAPDPVARYVVTFQSTWSRATHPDDWPDDAHYSGLIGGTHSSRVSFWQEGQLASPGIQLMAEKGRKSPLDQEVAAAIAAGHAQFILSGDALSGSPRSVSLEFEIGVNFPLVTLVTMVAPSPDWFVGVSGLSLLPNGQWAEEIVATVFPWDAGTDSGVTYAAENFASVPPQPIHRLLGFPVAVNGVVAPFGRMRFVRLK